MSNCDVAFRCDPTIDEFIDVVEGGRVYIPVVYVLNKIDAISIEELGEFLPAPEGEELGRSVADRRDRQISCTRSPTPSPFPRASG